MNGRTATRSPRASAGDAHAGTAGRAATWTGRIHERLARTGLIAGLTLGAAAGLVDVAWSGYHRAAGRLVFTPEWFWWAAPWVNAAIVATATVVAVALVAAVLSRHRHWVRYAVPIALATGAALLIVPGLHRLALVILALGVGIRGGTLLARRARQADRVMAWSLPVLLLVLPLLSSLAFSLPAAAGGNAAVAARSGLPNIIIIVLDTVRALEMSLYGGRAGTSPTIDRLGAQGVVFDRASSTAPWTLPSHASLFTGHWAHELSGSLLTPLDDSVPTLAEALADLGYHTAGFTANVEYASAETGLARGFALYQDHRPSLSGTVHLTRLGRFLSRNVTTTLRIAHDQPGRVGADLINRRFLGWLERTGGTPFFAFLNYYDAHAPYYPPEPQWSRFVGPAPRIPVNNPHEDADHPDRVELQRRAYAGAINHIDGRIAQLVDSLEAAGLLENTLIVITSDHGEEFAEHGIIGHGNTLYLPSVHVPLMMTWPARIPAGCRVAVPVSIRDVPATIMDLIGGGAAFPGRSLVATWEADEGETEGPAVYTHTQRAINQPAHFPASRGPVVGVERWPWRLLAETDPVSIQLFDRSRDPGELHDLSRDAAAGPVLTALLDSLARTGMPVDLRDGPTEAAGSLPAAPLPAASCPGG